MYLLNDSFKCNKANVMFLENIYLKYMMVLCIDQILKGLSRIWIGRKSKIEKNIYGAVCKIRYQNTIPGAPGWLVAGWRLWKSKQQLEDQEWGKGNNSGE